MLDFVLLTGNANRPLADAIAVHLGRPLGNCDVYSFSNENVFARINQTVRGFDVFVIQPFTTPVNTSIIELLVLIDALKRASAGRITAVIPYFAYGRTDKKDQPRVPISARLMANLIERAGAHRILTIDLHAGQIEGFFDIPVDHLTASPLLSGHFRARALDDAVVVAPDLGSAKKARNFAEALGTPLAFIEKRRPLRGGGPEILNVIGDVRHRRAILIDDEIDTASSMVGAARVLATEGVGEIHVAATHGVFSGQAIERLESGPFDSVVVTDTATGGRRPALSRLTVISVAELLAEAIRRIHAEGSVSALFATT
ncbi:MAG: ribose-phosphate pyrophosphokinase [Chloroflexi bacterium]|nr:ribose-phosphate pyrophosphokinase [Chloroflexota bacterium]